MAKKLIAYYSRADENYVSGRLQMLEEGNTEKVANVIKEATGADIYKIEQVKPYSKDYNQCIDEAKKDRQSGARPELKYPPKDLGEYAEIYLGYPNYWGTMPMAVFTFLESCDLSNKTIKPFCTHEGSGLGNSIADIKKLCPDANVKEGLALFGSRVDRARAEIERWV